MDSEKVVVVWLPPRVVVVCVLFLLYLLGFSPEFAQNGHKQQQQQQGLAAAKPSRL